MKPIGLFFSKGRDSLKGCRRCNIVVYNNLGYRPLFLFPT